ncbi:hypothetical protein [Treponema denticola]|uniref:hypothetical protein n=1 Tax=Treponema denticola TaxID=158 RepID=UPI002103ABE4|nr:hypothetical protein [Treponema denticola]UTY23429.1 hypothetical protein E4N78_04225 [Treponema denticola]
MILANLTNDFIDLFLLGVLLLILLIKLITCRKSEENGKIYYITSKKIYCRLLYFGDSYHLYYSYKIILKQANSSFLNRLTIPVTGKEFSLLKEGDLVFCTCNTETMPTEIYEEKFNGFIEMKGAKKEGFQ